MSLKKKTIQALRVSLFEMRSNTATPPVTAPLDWAVSHQTPFPWLNSVSYLPAAPPPRCDEHA